MEELFGDAFLKDNNEVEADEVLLIFKEFMLIFYGASWSLKSNEMSERISSFLIDQNPDDESQPPSYEAFYISNDESKDEFKQFYAKMCEEAPYWSTFPWNDPRIVNMKNALNLESLPQVLVMDKNLNIVTSEGVDDLMNLEPDVCRSLWISLLKKQIKKRATDQENE